MLFSQRAAITTRAAAAHACCASPDSMLLLIFINFISRKRVLPCRLRVRIEKMFEHFRKAPLLTIFFEALSAGASELRARGAPAAANILASGSSNMSSQARQ